MDANKEVVKTPEQLEEELVISKINAVLAEHGYAFVKKLIYMEDAIVPGIKIAKLPKEEPKDLAAKI